MKEQEFDFGGSLLFETFPIILGLLFFIASMGIFFLF